MNGTLKAQDFSKPNLAGTNKMNIALVKKDSGKYYLLHFTR
jgi:hypothetical protein